MTKKIGYLGPRGTFTKIAVDAIFNGEDKESYTTIPECIDALDAGEVTYGVLPLENAIEGTVNVTLDYLIEKKDIKIISEVIVPIRQHLMVHPSQAETWRDIETIYSHPHAIAQCHHFLHNDMKHVKAESVSSTGAAAKYVSEHPELHIGAIANHLAAEEYGLSIVKKDIHDFTNNHTRFVVLHKQSSELLSKRLEVKGHKTSLIITLPSDHPGALHQVLSAFAWRKVNLSKIESRPMKTGLGNYYFLIDVEQKMDDVLIPNTIAELESLGCSVDVLGSYPYFLLNGISVHA
ncbi:prephenate dehydratase [Aquibacillus koreensis]|uniref:Prephenate dehydratase n=1 Tax=Aquibacillus koreensis TaxID=279446 RepID=A0A9X4AGP5_9BACI|nr:prephenate dehydratase [Aquibacillus koreensis]MCT2537968.1 prephenate dehydratase [Aquibacillus koreensis]MDC3419141.1 prephenate dehydratase [Aquibacillus koreensis]